MKLLALVFTCFVAISHVGILVLEMFFWNHPVGQKIFAMTPEVAESSAVLAMNQGLYNGFLAAGLFGGVIATVLILNCSSWGVWLLLASLVA